MNPENPDLKSLEDNLNALLLDAKTQAKRTGGTTSFRKASKKNLNPAQASGATLHDLCSKMDRAPKQGAFELVATVCVTAQTECSHCAHVTFAPRGLFLKRVHPSLGEHNERLSTEDFFNLHLSLPRETKTISETVPSCSLCFDSIGLPHTETTGEPS